MSCYSLNLLMMSTRWKKKKGWHNCVTGPSSLPNWFSLPEGCFSISAETLKSPVKTLIFLPPNTSSYSRLHSSYWKSTVHCWEKLAVIADNVLTYNNLIKNLSFWQALRQNVCFFQLIFSTFARSRHLERW